MTIQKQLLTKKQIDEILSEIVISFDMIPDVIEQSLENIRKNLRIDLSSVMIYPEVFDEFKSEIIRSFNKSLIQPKFPIGPICADAFSQQATQKNLNTFHNVGAQTNGNGTLSDPISLPKKRKNQYSVIHFNNVYNTFEDIMKYQKDFLSVNVKSLILTLQYHEISFSDTDWWYNHQNISKLSQDKNKNVIRIVFDIQKLYDNKITTFEISNAIEKMFQNKKIVSKCIYSPTVQGIIDIFFIESQEVENKIMASLMRDDFLSKVFVSGIEEIKSFYGVKKPIKDLIRDSEIINNKLNIYISLNRVEAIPFSKLFKLITMAGYTLDPLTTSLNDIYTLFDYNPLKLKERRQIIYISARDYKNRAPHKYYSVTKIEENEEMKTWKVEVDLPYVNSPFSPCKLETLFDSEFLSNSEIKTTNIKTFILLDNRYSILFNGKWDNIQSKYYNIISNNNNYKLIINHNALIQDFNESHDVKQILNQEIVSHFSQISNDSYEDLSNISSFSVIADKYIPNNAFTIIKKEKNRWDMQVTKYISKKEFDLLIKKSFIFVNKPWTIIKDEKIEDINKIIINTNDSYDIFMKNISNVIFSKIKIIQKDEIIIISSQYINEVTLILKKMGVTFNYENEQFLIYENNLEDFKLLFKEMEEKLLIL